MQTRVRISMFVSFALALSLLCAGCFEETQLLVLNKDGSGHYESVIRFNPQMSTFIEMAEKIEGVKGSPTEGSPFDLVNGHLETTIRSQVEEIEGAHLLKLELTQVGEKNEQRQIALSIDFDDINTFLASPLSAEKLGLRLSRDDHENLRLAGTPGILAARPAIGIGAPSPGTMISEMKSEFGIANDPEFDALFRRLLGSPKSALTFDVPTPITQTNGILVTESKIEWKVDIIDAADALDEYLYEVVLAGEELEFEVREMPPSMAMPPPIMPSSSLLGQPAPGFTLPDLEGNPVSLSDFKGKVVILDFWATWCGPCVVEIPHFIRFQEEFGKKGFTMLGISTDDGVNVVKKFVEEYQVNYPNLMADGNVKALYGGVRSIPTTFVLDRDGVIQRHYVGTQPELLFRRDVETLLAGGELPPQSMHRMPPPGPPQPPLHGSFGATGVVRGNIVEATMEQNLITDVRVVIVDTEGTAYETTTDSQGDYEISGLPPGRYLISVRREGYRERLGKPVAVVAGGDHYVPIKMTKGP